jgi:hypothetical protein
MTKAKGAGRYDSSGRVPTSKTEALSSNTVLQLKQTNKKGILRKYSYGQWNECKFKDKRLPHPPHTPRDLHMLGKHSTIEPCLQSKDKSFLSMHSRKSFHG